MTPAKILPRRILVIDDEPMMCQAIKMYLRVDHHEVVLATTPTAALTECANCVFDLVCLDYSMPDMNGDELARLIKTKDPKQPIVMITGSSCFTGGSGELPYGVEQVLGKPFSIDQLRQAVERFSRPLIAIPSPNPQTNSRQG